MLGFELVSQLVSFPAGCFFHYISLRHVIIGVDIVHLSRKHPAEPRFLSWSKLSSSLLISLTKIPDHVFFPALVYQLGSNVLVKSFCVLAYSIDPFDTYSKPSASTRIFHWLIEPALRRDAGIDQLNFHSVQLGYLKFLQMGNADPHKTKAGNKYEVKPQYEERTKQINMQHAINQCYECMRAAKEITQLGQCINRQNISGRLYTVGDPDPPPGKAAEEHRIKAGRRSIRKIDNSYRHT
ncbi:hypothetical protein F511_41456 [Dorcoceras hygrometricum]|uniref:Uncharacterized protein n=1 Tax=Dorcoceras hygrometricum TaxID=472368 RepID=A0A2Z7BBE9_9LAMI|nr:hypothetical protein F511_41456 [Dorcoceras hygrometricum]